MKSFVLGSVTFACGLVFAGPSVDPLTVTFAQPKVGSAEITYVLRGAPAVITVDVQTNAGNGTWATIGADKVRTLTGDVNKIVQPGDEPRRLSWKCSVDWTDHVVKDGNLRAVVEVWPLNAPPPWLVIDLETRALSCYRDEAAMPHPLKNELYKTSCYVMRKVPAAHATWTMGTPDSMMDASWKKNGKPITGYYERVHTVTFTEDYYLAVYPLTQAQNTILQGNMGIRIGLNISGADISPLKPAAGLSYQHLRGAVAEYNWPQDGHAVDPNYYLGRMRAYIGHGLEFDLPTESQWEFACRAGETGNWNTGTDDWTTCCYSGDKASLCEVGYSRNKWGFYDMHGNAGSLCLEIITETYALGLSYVNPPGEYGTANVNVGRCTRGGWYSLKLSEVPIYCRCGSRYRYNITSAGPVWALRAAAPARLSAE